MIMSKRLWTIAAMLVICSYVTLCNSNAQELQAIDKTMDSSQFVNITDVVPDAILEVRYFSTYNFVGTRVDGYEEPVILMTRQAADSLRAVDHFVRWAIDETDTITKAYFYPNLTKKQVFDGDYIAKKSGHSRGSTVDLTLLDMATGKELDMGGTFDWFGPESHPDYGGGNPETLEFEQTIPTFTSEQFYNRMVLRTAMMHHGFLPLDNEWWHFRLNNEPFPNTYFNFPVRTLSKQ